MIVQLADMRREISRCIALALFVLLSSSSKAAQLNGADAEQCDASGPRADCGAFLRGRKQACIVGTDMVASSDRFHAIHMSLHAAILSPRVPTLRLPCSLHVCIAAPMLPRSLWLCRRLRRHRQREVPGARLLLAAGEAIPTQAAHQPPMVLPSEQPAKSIRRGRRRADRCAGRRSDHCTKHSGPEALMLRRPSYTAAIDMATGTQQLGDVQQHVRG